MARRVNRLAAVAVPKLGPGMHPDGLGLYLKVGGTGARSWVFRYDLGGRRRHLGLGAANTLNLQGARLAAQEARKSVAEGRDPVEARQRAKVAQAVQASRMAFGEAAEAFVSAQEAGWKSPKHRQQWRNTLKTYCQPIWRRDVGSISTEHVLAVLRPIWVAKHETASRVRGRIERVLDWARVRGLREGENPARWRGHVALLLPSISKVGKVRHHPALPYGEVARFVAALRSEEGSAARALELTILTACRTSEVLQAEWSEIDLKKALWTIPATRMKSKRAHRVPLSPAALKLLKAQHAVRYEQFVFPGARQGRPLSGMAMLMTLRRMKRADITPHGFRSSFRQWVGECTAHPSEVAEHALAHVVGSEVERAYARSDLFERRRVLMNDWANWCGGRK